MIKGHFVARMAALAFAFSALVRADIVVSLGDTAPGFANGAHPTSATVLAALTGSAPFNAFCGSDGSLNCSANWTFNFSIPTGQTVNAATLTLGIFDIDSAAAGNQVASYMLGTTDLTATFNVVSESLNGGGGATNSEYDVLTLAIPSAAFATLQGGSATVSLALQGPGLGVIGATPDNGAGLVFSTLDVQTAEPTPEPASLALVLSALGGLSVFRSRRKQRAEL